MSKKISVIIPCYNVSPYVDRCMRSLESQTMGMEDLEIILINDASTDATLGKLMLWEMKYPDSIVVIPLEQNVMQGAARNIARGYCSGEYIAYLDADDWLLPDALKMVYDAAAENEADIVNYLSKRTYKGPEETDSDYESDIPDKLVTIESPAERMELFTGDCPLARGCWDKLFRRDFVEENDLLFAEGVYDEESLFTIPAYMKMKRVFFLNKYLHRYFQNPVSTSYNLAVSLRRRDDNAKVWLATCERLRADGSLAENPELVERFFVINYFVRSFVYAAQRHIPFDAPTVCAMQDKVRELFPDYKNNRSLRGGGFYTEALKFMDIPVNDANIDSFNAAWEQIVAAFGEDL